MTRKQWIPLYSRLENIYQTTRKDPEAHSEEYFDALKNFNSSIVHAAISHVRNTFTGFGWPLPSVIRQAITDLNLSSSSAVVKPLTDKDAAQLAFDELSRKVVSLPKPEREALYQRSLEKTKQDLPSFIIRDEEAAQAMIRAAARGREVLTYCEENGIQYPLT